ncbi:TatD family hydrolase [Mycoplasma buteonis]|uniref:TatD family hydrolase n=1 Tax=Mycoplasma buteonis TaxID=171280 RepID=UPI00056760D3|nr:TatD family hydrolase [Mycoplasma buteonis]
MSKKRNKFIDAHCHLSLKYYKNEEILDEIILATKHNRLEFLIVNGGHAEENLETLKLAEKYPEIVKPCVGLHPEDKLSENDGEIIEKIVNNQVVGIGEIGLEYFYETENSREIQLKSLESQILLALKLDLPVVVHLRDKDDSEQAYQDFYQIMKKYPNLRVMLHTYAGTKEWSEKFLTFKNLYFSFSGVATFGSADQTREVIKFLPLDRILTETDSPYLRVHPYTGETNEPNTVLYVSYYLAGLKSVSMEKFVDRVNRNLRTLFRITDAK